MVRHSTQVITARYEVILSKVSNAGVFMEEGDKLVIHTPTLD